MSRLMDLAAQPVATRSAALKQVNRVLQVRRPMASFPDYWAIPTRPHASVDFNRDPRSGIVDATQTRVSGGTMIKLLCWFDNEWGFANRMLDVGPLLAEPALRIPSA